MPPIQVLPPEVKWADELAELARTDTGPRPPGWKLSPRAVVRFITGEDGETPRFVGQRALVERAVITLAGTRGLLLVGEPGTAKSMLSELLAAAVCGTSGLTVQGTAGTTEDQLRYGWNYAMLLASGPRREALVPSPILTAMETGAIARVEEITRCLPEVQDALVSILSERRLMVPELGEAGVVHARPGFSIIATANLRDRGVSEMSAALKRRFNFETVLPIAQHAEEVALVRRQVQATVEPLGVPAAVDETVLDALVTTFRDMRGGRTAEGWPVEKPGAVLSTAEAVGVASSITLESTFFDGRTDPLALLPGYLLGVVQKDDPKDRERLLAYWDGAIKRRSDPTTAHPNANVWRRLLALRRVIEEG